MARLPSRPPTKAGARPAGITRRQTLLGLGSTTAAGLGFVGWKMRGRGSAASGKQRWLFRAGDSVSSSPAVAGGVVFVGCRDGNLYAVDAASGEQRWKIRTGGAVLSSPAVAGGVVYVGSQDGNLYAVDAATGVRAGGTPTYSTKHRAGPRRRDCSSRGRPSGGCGSTASPRWRPQSSADAPCGGSGPAW
ncbi:PQQ-binding-like beta-propeller repeat protein [Streptomyces sp. NPDC057474]|uniref:outer membrane protein assembly factor BamB family protein n=1 Tax=Streptomyces sp. NPDC057474 TaxID=3346144 RepID=UPI0036899530